MGALKISDFPSSKSRATGVKGTCLMVTTYYPAFLAEFYGKDERRRLQNYETQLNLLHREFFGESDFYSSALTRWGWATSDVIVNCAPLQSAWASEHDQSANGLELLVRRVATEKPTVVYLQDLSLATKPLIEALRPHTEIIAGQIACPVSAQTHYAGIDVIFSSFPHFVERFRAAGIKAFYVPLAFEPRVSSVCVRGERDLPFTFIGGISNAHSQGTQNLEFLARHTDVQVWGYGKENLGPESVVRSRHNGPAWGHKMFELMGRSQITFNRHINVAEQFMNNMRVFEATGCGAMLLTDEKQNTRELFEPDKEIVTYESMDDCIEKVRFYLRRPDLVRAIAQAGQRRTLRLHNWDNRMKEVALALELVQMSKRRGGRI